MRRSESSESQPQKIKSRHWKKRLPTVCFAVFVLGACCLIRFLDAPTVVTAQTARKARPSSEAASVAKPSKPKIVAVVNGRKITRTELGRECIRRHGTKVLESEVNKRLILAACKQQGVKITNADIEAEIARMANKFGLSTGRWLAMLKDERDITPFQYRRDIVWPTLALRRMAKDSLHVTDDELQLAYESEYGPMVQARLISTKSKARAEQLHAKAVARPELFDRLA